MKWHHGRIQITFSKCAYATVGYCRWSQKVKEGSRIRENSCLHMKTVCILSFHTFQTTNKHTNKKNKPTTLHGQFFATPTSWYVPLTFCNQSTKSLPPVSMRMVSDHFWPPVRASGNPFRWYLLKNFTVDCFVFEREREDSVDFITISVNATIAQIPEALLSFWRTHIFDIYFLIYYS